jgi:hypothetical protein
MSKDKTAQNTVSSLAEESTISTRAATNCDMIIGWRFSASMMPWVRLSVLRRHGEFHAGSKVSLPTITNDLDEGIWSPVTRTFRDLGIDIEPHATMASAVGYIASDGGEFLPFLIEMRECVETGDNASQRACLAQVTSKPRWRDFVKELGGAAEIRRRFRL